MSRPVSLILGLEPALDLASIVLRRFRRPAYSSLCLANTDPGLWLANNPIQVFEPLFRAHGLNGNGPHMKKRLRWRSMVKKGRPGRLRFPLVQATPEAAP